MALQYPGYEVLPSAPSPLASLISGFEAGQQNRKNMDAEAALAKFATAAPSSPLAGFLTPPASPATPAAPSGDMLSNYIASTAQSESGNNPNARNPNSTATGTFQFTQPTWASLMQQHPELGLTAAGITDPGQQQKAMRAFTLDNARTLAKRGIEVNPGSLYAAHFLGPGGATVALEQPDNTPLANAVDPSVIQASPELAGMTVGQFKQWAAQKGGAPNGGYLPPGVDPIVADRAQQLAEAMGPQTAVAATEGMGSPPAAIAPTPAPVTAVAPAMAPAGPGLPDRNTMLALLRSPETRPFAISMIQAARKGQDPSTILSNELTHAKIVQALNGGPSKISYGQTPIVLTDPQDKIHIGQMSNRGGFLVDGQAYSSLPAGWKVGTVSQSGSGGLSDQALDIIATQYLAGDKSAIQGFARNATMRAQIENAVAKKADAMGMDGKAIAAEISAYGGNVAAQRAAGTRAAQVGMAASEADSMADIALDASKAVPRGAFVPLNAAENLVRTGTSSPEMASFVTATTSLVNAYARAVSPLGAPTDAMRAHAEQMLNTAQSPQAYAAVIAQMKKEMDAALNAPAEISNNLKSSITGTTAEPDAGDGKTYTYNPATGELE